MITINEIALFFLFFEFVAFTYNYKKGVGVFLFIYIVFPQSITELDFLNLTMIRLVLLIALLFFIKEIYFKKDNKSFTFPLWKPVLLFSAFLLPSYLFTEFSDGFPKGIYNYFVYFFADTFLPGIIVFYSIKSYNDLKIVLKWLVYAILIMGAYGLIEFASGFKNIFWEAIAKSSKDVKIYDYQDFDDRLGFTNRVKSTNIHAIVYGGRLALFVPLFMMLIADSRYRRFIRSNILLIIAFAMLIANEFLTLSRSCWVSAGIAFSVAFFLNRRRYFKRYSAFKFGLLIAAIPLLVYLIPMLIKIFTKSNIRGSSLSLRADQYHYIFNVIVAKQFYLGFGSAAISKFLDSGIYLGALGFESIIFEVFVTNGLVGFIGYLILYIAIFRYIFKGNKNNYTKPYFIALTIAHLAFVIITGERQTLMLYWIFVCIYIKMDFLFAQEAELLTTKSDNNDK
ncbi:O-antigen ligase family protein [Mucilaginibacter sp.]|uniref:O-antigen ligase family protein n=1 Tax=Mucilaginibacter sp. TaxID=1882438 RepID=UPI0028445CD0|nr:O-antigen ligase family protein [Mucilaginibacter sp.]MDR3696333.1 hypothetical protein [Mucilaginibacter sp.]